MNVIYQSDSSNRTAWNHVSKRSELFPIWNEDYKGKKEPRTCRGIRKIFIPPNLNIFLFCYPSERVRHSFQIILIQSSTKEKLYGLIIRPISIKSMNYPAASGQIIVLRKSLFYIASVRFLMQPKACPIIDNCVRPSWKKKKWPLLPLYGPVSLTIKPKLPLSGLWPVWRVPSLKTDGLFAVSPLHLMAPLLPVLACFAHSWHIPEIFPSSTTIITSLVFSWHIWHIVGTFLHEFIVNAAPTPHSSQNTIGLTPMRCSGVIFLELEKIWAFWDKPWKIEDWNT